MTTHKRYCPNLLPSEHRVLPDYFKGDSSSKPGHNSLLEGLSITLSIAVLVSAFFTTDYMPLSWTFIATGFLLIPGIGRAVARSLQVRLTPPVRAVALIVLMSVNVPFVIAFGIVKENMAEQQHFELIRQREVRKLAAEMERHREDSLAVCLQRIDTFYAQGETDKALQELDRADSMVRTLEESNTVNQKRIVVSLVKVSDLVQKRKYKPAIGLLNKLHEIDSTNTDVLYQRALCYSKTNRIAAAVHDAKQAKLRGHEAADKLYEKLNPLRKRIAYRTTLCQDGSYSSSSGRGSCSYHGGVADWNYPVYETYRKYE